MCRDGEDVLLNITHTQMKIKHDIESRLRIEIKGEEEEGFGKFERPSLFYPYSKIVNIKRITFLKIKTSSLILWRFNQLPQARIVGNSGGDPVDICGDSRLNLNRYHQQLRWCIQCPT
jgi:hypothetical protein